MQPVIRALNALLALGDHGGGMTLQELADKLALPLSTVHRILGVLEGEPFVVRTKRDRRFLLGPAVRGLVASTESSVLRRAAEPTMSRLNRGTGETVLLAELIGHDVVCIAISDGTRPLRLSVRLGHALPMHAAAAARVVLAEIDEPRRDEILDRVDFTRWTPRTIVERAELARHLAIVHERGFDICDDEMDNHVWAVAAPVRDVTGEVRCALALAAPLPTVGDAARRARLQAAVLAGAADVSLELGALHNPP